MQNIINYLLIYLVTTTTSFNLITTYCNYKNNLNIIRNITTQNINYNMKNSQQKSQQKYNIDNENNPVLIFPGLGGSRLLYKNTKRPLWPPTLMQYIFNFINWKKDIIDYKIAETLSFGDPAAFDMNIVLPNKYAKILKHANVFTMPYDFRRINDETYLNELFADVENYITSFDKPVTLLCHSTGGLLMHWFLHNKPREWKDKHIGKVINVSVPFGGIGLLLRICLYDTFDINSFIGKDIFRKMGASVINMPNPLLLTNPHNEAEFNKWSYLRDYELTDMHDSIMSSLQMINSFKEATDVKTDIVYCYNENKNTIKSVHKNKKGNLQIIYGDGDDVVSLESLTFPQHWGNTDIDAHDNVRFVGFYKCSHSGVLDKLNFII